MSVDKILLRQYLVVIIANLSVLNVGLGLAWPSPMLVKLRDPEQTVLDHPITDDEGAWVVSVGLLAGVLVNVLPALVLSRLGFKYTCGVALFPKFVGAVILLFANEVWMLILSRALGGIADIFIFTIVPTYASEVASKEIRGSLSTLLHVLASLGIVTMISVGPFVSYLAVNILQVSAVVLALISIAFLPESPYFLYTKERTNESLRVLTYLRGAEAADIELQSYSTSDRGEKVKKIEILKNRIFWKSLFLGNVLAIGAQLIGYNTISYYLQTILVSTQTGIQPEIASVVIGVIQLAAAFCTSAITDRFGRKPILFVTLNGMMAGMLGLGTFFYVTEDADVIVGFMNFLPLISLILVVLCYSGGCGSVNWALGSELFDTKSRGFGISIILAVSGITSFLMARYFPFLMDTLGPAVTFWVFSVNCLLLCAFVTIFIPETKCKTYNEIQQMLGAKIGADEEKAQK